MTAAQAAIGYLGEAYVSRFANIGINRQLVIPLAFAHADCMPRLTLLDDQGVEIEDQPPRRWSRPAMRMALEITLHRGRCK